MLDFYTLTTATLLFSKLFYFAVNKNSKYFITGIEYILLSLWLKPLIKEQYYYYQHRKCGISWAGHLWCGSSARLPHRLPCGDRLSQGGQALVLLQIAGDAAREGNREYDTSQIYQLFRKPHHKLIRHQYFMYSQLTTKKGEPALNNSTS